MFWNRLANLLKIYVRYKNGDLAMRFASKLVIGGFSLLAGGSGLTWAISAELVSIELPLKLDIVAERATIYGLAAVITGTAIAILRIQYLQRKLTGILIVHRGMEGMETHHVQKALPASFRKGRLDIIELAEGHQLHNGVVVSPHRALDVINHLDQQLATRIQGRNTADTQLAYAGLAPIPLLVAAGYKMTARKPCIVLDYARAGHWHALEYEDDNEAIRVTEPNEPITSDVAIVLPLSVNIATSQLPEELTGKAYTVTLAKGARMDSLNSEDKQKRLAELIYNLLSNIQSTHPNVETIHIFLASQASFAFRFGTMITSSVMSSISVYQYNSLTHRYGWCATFQAGAGCIYQSGLYRSDNNSRHPK